MHRLSSFNDTDPTMNATTAAKNVANNATQTTAAAAQACCQGANEALKAGVDANQKMFGAFANAFSNPFANPFMANWNTDAFTTAIPAAFEKMSKAMHGMIEANARYATECNALVIDAMRTNARTMERTGNLMVSQLTGTNGPTGKSAKPVVDAAREIFDEASGFTTKAGERLMKLNTEHAQQVVQIMEQAMTCNGTQKTACCNA
jgi:hypothetical protein